MRTRFLVYALLLLLFGGLVLFSCQPKVSEEKAQTSYASLIDTNNYIGKEACRQCHADKYETFIHTGMGMSFDSATAKKTSARFSKHEVIYDKDKNFYYYPHFENDHLYIKEFRLKGNDTVYVRNERITYIVGSGQHTNSHMINVNGYVYQAPATFYTQSGKWDLPPGFENGYNNRFSRLIEMECMSCHNAFPKMVLGSANKYESIPSGIDCERCHGPGSIHQQQKLAGLIVDVKQEIDYSIVNPAKLDIDRQMDVCQRCHVQGNAVLQPGKSFLDFKPGMHLSEVMNVFMPVYKGDEDAHIMASHAERLKLSKCITESMKIAERNNKSHPSIEPYKNAMTCITCHDPHVSVRSTDKEVFNNACRSCHYNVKGSLAVNPIIHSEECSESQDKRKAVSDNCVSCHMPKNGTIDIPHVTTTDHWIRKSIDKKKKESIREFVRLACINNPNVDRSTMAEAYLNYFEKFVSKTQFLDSAKKYLDDSNSKLIQENFADLIRWSFLKNDYRTLVGYVNAIGLNADSLKVMSYTNTDAWTAYRIGQAYVALNEAPVALVYFQKAVELAPYYADFRLKLADQQFDLSDFSAAEKNYRFVMKENPDNTKALVNYGYLALSWKKDVGLAESCYRQALQIDTDNLQALLNLAGSSLFKGDRKLAKSYFQKVLEIDPKNQEANKFISML